MEGVLPSEILEKIVNFVDSLHHCRLVNRRWNYLASEAQTSTHSPIQFTTEYGLKDFLNCFTTSRQPFPFSKFHFQLEKFTMNENLNTFFQQYGSSVREVSFELRVKHFGVIQLEKLKCFLSYLSALPRLFRLSVNVSCRMPAILEGASGILQQAILSLKCIEFMREITTAKDFDDGRLLLLHYIQGAAQNLNEIKVTPWKGTQLSRILPLLSIYKKIPRLTLANVILLTYDPLDVQFLKDKSFKLTSLHLRVKYDYDKASENLNFNYDHVRSAFFSWLEHMSDTLRDLTLILEEVSDLTLPNLGVLESLDIGLGTYNDVDMGNPLLPFLPTQFPNLTKVSINFYSEDWKLFSGIFSSVKSLRIQGYQEEFLHERWNHVFPNLKTLSLACLKENQLDSILKQFAAIEHLKLELRQTTTRYSENNCMPINFLTNNDTLKMDFLRCYKELRSLEIYGCNDLSISKLIKMSQEGVLKSLDYLAIKGNINSQDLELLRAIHWSVWIT